MTWRAWAAQELDVIRSKSQWRSTKSFDAFGIEGMLSGSRVVSFASNDYLGLSTHPAVLEAARSAIDRWGTGATASRLVTGTRPVHHELEHELALWKKTERAIVFPTGFAANMGVLSVFGTEGVTIISDEANHASIIDGCRQAKAEVLIFRHKDMDHLSSLLKSHPRSIVVTDVVFSMDGDEARLPELVEICSRANTLLVLDEAHCVLTSEVDLSSVEVLRVGTLSKALGSLGGFVAGAQPLIDLLINRARSFIFSTGSTPPDMAAALAAVRVLNGPEGSKLKKKLRDLVEMVRPGHPSPIIPVMLGAEQKTLEASDHLLNAGLLVPAIRPPTVPTGTSRLRIALSAAHTEEQVNGLTGVLRNMGIDVTTMPLPHACP